VYPDFLIVGAEKSGTTSLAYYLQEHNDIFIPDKKEIQFFLEKNYHKGPDWYKKHFEDHNNKKLIGEATPLYMYFEFVPKRIFKLIPDVKLIFIMRNPIYRAYSKYWHVVVGGFEYLSFEKALTCEYERIKKNLRFRELYSYQDAGYYYNQIKNYLNYFKKKQMCFLLFDDLVKKPQKVLNEIYDFLEIKRQKCSRIGEIKNKKDIPLSINFQLWLNKSLNIDRGIYLPENRTSLWKLITSAQKIFGRKNYPKMKNETKVYLYNKFAYHNKKLEKLIGKDLSMWKSVC